MYLLDTDIISLLRRPGRHPVPARWVAAQRPSDLYLSVVTLGEVERGIAQESLRNPDFARDLTAWVERTIVWFADHILPVDIPTARRWGRLLDAIGNQSADLLIAATALEHGLTVVTRNVRHFRPAGVPVLDPFHNGPATESSA